MILRSNSHDTEAEPSKPPGCRSRTARPGNSPFGREAALCLGSGGCHDRSLAQDAGELIVHVFFRRWLRPKRPLERDSGGHRAVFRLLGEDAESLVSREDFLVPGDLALLPLAFAHGESPRLRPGWCVQPPRSVCAIASCRLRPSPRALELAGRRA